MENKIKCKFENANHFLIRGYTCIILNQNIPDCTELSFNGHHRHGNSNDRVVVIKFHLCKIKNIPKGLKKVFPNLEHLVITASNLRTLRKDDLIEYKDFKSFDFSANPIEFLPDDLFEDIYFLEKVSFNSCNLSLIEPNIFSNVHYLKFICLTGNPDYDFLLTDNSDEDSYIEKYRDLERNLYEIYYSKLKAQQKWENSYKNLHQDVHALIGTLRNQTFLNSMTDYQQGHKNEELKRKVEKVQADLQNEEIKLIENFNEQHQKLTKLREILNLEFQNLKFSKEKLKRRIQNAELSSQPFQNYLNVDVKNLIQDESFKDFKIIVEDREFPVHKFLLAARSPTLAEMLRKSPEAENLKLVDISVDIFELILKFLYNDDLQMEEDGTNFLHLFAAAGRLGIKALKNYAASKLLNIIDAENSIEILNLSNKYPHDDLRQKVFDEIKKNYPKIEFKDEWIEDGQKILKIIRAFVAKEEATRKADEEFKNLLI